MTVAVTALIENCPSGHKGLFIEHGLSFHVKTDNLTFLLDCGAGPNFLHNAFQLNIDLEELDFVVLSHGHFDHTGGYRGLAAKSAARRLITGEGFFEPKYAREGMRHTYIGVNFDQRFLFDHSIVHETCGDLLPLGDDCWVVGNFERTVAEETIPERFVVRKGFDFHPDAFRDEVCVAVRFEDGLAVLAGCSHPGILNLLKTVQKRLNLPIRGVWGGTHLMVADDARVAMTLAELKRMGVRYMGLSHCSGEKALEAIRNDPDITGCHLRTGDGVFL